MRTLPTSVPIVTGALVINCLLAACGGPLWAAAVISLAGPFLIVWMVMDVLTNRAVVVRDLNDDQWGYQDRPDLHPRHH